MNGYKITKVNVRYCVAFSHGCMLNEFSGEGVVRLSRAVLAFVGSDVFPWVVCSYGDVGLTKRRLER
jgi:hypothetical protein